MRLLLSCVLAGGCCLALTGCGEGEFGEYQVRELLTIGPKQLEGEQITLTPGQVECGEREELWVLESRGGHRSVGRLTDAARALNFADDVQIGDTPLPPYAQVRGKFQLQVTRVTAIRDDDSRTKTVEAKVGVEIRHSCFGAPLPLMGVRKGNFNPDTPARFQLTLGNGWEYARILH
jgi:hypothetical protein